MKQVIVMRKDLKMNKGKMIAQGAHASMIFLLDNYWRQDESLKNWVYGGMAKIAAGVETGEELISIIDQARKAGLIVHDVIDSGKTVFQGVPTLTCCAIGPNDDAEINKITGHLKLL